MTVLKPNNANAVSFAVLALMTLVPGLYGPFMTVVTMGNEKTYSICGILESLANAGQWLLFCVILLFSVAFPFTKLIFLVVITTRLCPISEHTCRRLFSFAEKTARFSMLDVMALALLVVVLKVEGVAHVNIAWGTICFFLSVVLSMIAGFLVDGSSFCIKQTQPTT